MSAVFLFVLGYVFVARLYQLVSAENAEVRFWEIMQDFAEKLFLVPAPPKGMLALVSCVVSIAIVATFACSYLFTLTVSFLGTLRLVGCAAARNGICDNHHASSGR